jgi:hypothetical protein
MIHIRPLLSDRFSFLCSLTVCSPNSSSLVHFDFRENCLIFEFGKGPLDCRRLGKINIKHCKITCFLGWSLDLVRRKALSSSVRHLTISVQLTLFTQSFSHETCFTGLTWLSVVKLAKKNY